MNPKEKLKTLLVASLQTLPKDWELMAAIQFGSTVRLPALKTESDVDLLLVFRNLPHRRERHEVISEWENSLQTHLNAMVQSDIAFRSQSHVTGLYLSIQIKSLEEFETWSKIYLDMQDTSHCLFEKESVFTKLMQKVRDWCARNGAHKRYLGEKWYWVYSDNLGKNVELSFLK